MRPETWGAFKTTLLAAILIATLAQAQTTKHTEPEPKPIQITAATPSTTQAPLYGRIQIQVDLQATYQNPFSPVQITLDAQVTPPSGKTYTVPGFYYQPFTRDLDGKGETLKPAGQPTWQIRLALLEKGVNKVVITAKDKTGTATTKEIDLTATDSKSHGFVLTSPRDFHYFEFTDGAPFFPIGATLQSHQGLIDIETWLPALTASGGNAARLFLAPENSPFALVTKASGAYKLDLANAWRLDQALDLMDKDNIHPILCLDTFNELRDRDLDPHWTKNPYNKDNGGPINTDKEFWTDPTIDRVYNAKLRYVVARYGAYENVVGWELWEDTDDIHSFDPDVLRDWIQRHGEILKSLDPYSHLVTTSFSRPLGDRAIDHLPEIDFTQTHIFNVPDLVAELTLQLSKKSGYGKPHLITEVAADRQTDKSNLDKNGLQVHDPAWASVAFGASGVAMPWWWDASVFPKRTYNRFNAIAAFTKGIDWPGQHFRTATPSFAFQAPLSTPIYKDLLIDRGPVSFGDTEFNLPRHVRFRPGGVAYGLPVSGVLQGGRLHPSKFNPIDFDMDLRRATQFDLMIGDVSGVGGANVQVKLDGDVVLGLDMPDPDGLDNDDNITKYHGTYSLHIPSGHHHLVVADVGNDWVMAGYRFRDVFERTSPPLLGYAVLGDTRALAWVRHADRSWDRIEVQKRPVQTCPATFMTLQGLLPGSWRLELWDTWAGKITKSTRITVGSDGVATVNLPEIDADLAVKLIKLTAAPKKKAQAR